MTPTRRIPSQAPVDPDTGSLAYWMGKVDANLVEMKTTILAFISRSEAVWTEYEVWRRSVDERLQAGAINFDDHNRRLCALEAQGKPPDNTSKKNGNGHSATKFGTWEWFRDSYLEKGVFIILSLALYKVIELLAAYWNIIPTK